MKEIRYILAYIAFWVSCLSLGVCLFCVIFRFINMVMAWAGIISFFSFAIFLALVEDPSYKELLRHIKRKNEEAAKRGDS